MEALIESSSNYTIGDKGNPKYAAELLANQGKRSKNMVCYRPNVTKMAHQKLVVKN